MRSIRFIAAFALLALGGCEQIEARRSIQAGNAHYEDKYFDKAAAKFEEGLKLRPDLSVGWWNLGMAHLAMFAPGLETPENLAHAGRAIDALEKYLELEPDDKAARDQLLGVYINSGRYEGAIAFYEGKLKKDPTDVEAVAQVAEIHAMAKEYDESFVWYRKLVEMESSNDGKATAYYDMGRIAFGRLNRHPEVKGVERARVADEGVAALQKAVELRPAHEPSWRFMSLVLRERALAEGATWARGVDIAHAERYRKHAEELLAEERKKAAAAPAVDASGRAPTEGK